MHHLSWFVHASLLDFAIPALANADEGHLVLGLLVVGGDPLLAV